MRTRPFFIIFFLVAVLFVFSSCDKCKDDPADLIAAQLETNKQIAAAVVHSSAIGLSESLKNIPDSASGVQFIRTYIDSIRFYDDKSGYFYVYNYQCINIAHATQKDLQGKDLYNHQDSKGKYVVRELSATAKAGGGFVDFYWVKPGETGEKLKIGYVEPIPGTNFWIGSGVYIPE
jgi:signal transduction histidine kinase